MVIFGIGFAIIVLFLLCVLYILDKESEDVGVSAALGAICFGFFIGSVSCFGEYFHPSITPMDVYQGKTTLEITYKDGIAIDSVVVWKEE